MTPEPIVTCSFCGSDKGFAVGLHRKSTPHRPLYCKNCGALYVSESDPMLELRELLQPGRALC